jgi:N-acyl-D-aspartate/D-glutamate deacylase
MDQYPYDASGGGIQSGILPTWVLQGGREAVLKRLKDSDQRAKIKGEVTDIIRRRGGPGYLPKIVISHCQWDDSLAGKTLADVARMRGKSASAEDGAEAVLWIAEQGDCEKILRNNMNEIDIEITLEEAVRKMSSFPAQRLGLRYRGSIQTGMKADMVVFDPSRVRDRATYEASHRYAEGISLVIVNGQVVFEDGAMTSARPGRVLSQAAFPARPRLSENGSVWYT